VRKSVLGVLTVTLLAAAPAGATGYEFEWANPVPQGNGLYAMDFEDSLIGYAVGSKGTCMKTTDGGQTWIDQTSFPTFIKNLRDVMVMGPGDLIAVGENPGIFRSLDGGQSWTAVPNPSTETLNNVEVIAGDTLSAVGDLGHVLRSTDGGGTWSFLPSPGGAQTFDQYWFNGQVGYVVGVHVSRQTSDGGQTWDPMPGVPEPNTYTKIHFLDSQNGWLIQHFTTYRTTDGGTTWFEKHPPVLQGPHYQEEVVFIDASHRFVVSFLEGAIIWETIDDGLNFTIVYSRTRTAGYTDIERLADGSMVVCSTYGDLLRSTDTGQTWVNFTQSPDDADRSRLTVMTLLPGGKAYAGGNDFSWLTSTDGGNAWEIPPTPPDIEGVRAIEFRNDDFGLAGGYKTNNPSTVHRTTDGGGNWISHLLTGGFVGSVYGIAIPGDTTCYAVTYGGVPINHVFRSRDSGQSWEDVTNEIPTDGRFWSVFFTDVDTGFVAGGTSSKDALLWMTVNAGDSWAPVATSGVEATIEDMHWMGTDTGIVFNHDGGYRTTDGGATWTEVISGGVRGADFRDGLHGVAGHSSGESVWLTSDAGITWESVAYPWEQGPLGVLSVPDGFYVCGDGTTILGGHERDPTSVSGGIPPGAGSSSALLSVAPNPFNPTTTIRFEVPKSGSIVLAVYDVSGRRVVTLATGHHQAGPYKTTWNGTNDRGQVVGSGVYFVNLNGRGFNATSKTILLK
jgi:photosystem II stability/assembly factor-like uncharacterized protein